MDRAAYSSKLSTRRAWWSKAGPAGPGDRALVHGPRRRCHPGRPSGAGESLTLSYHLDYGQDSAIGNQSFLIDLTPPTFRSGLASAGHSCWSPKASASRRGYRQPGHPGRCVDIRPRRGHGKHVAVPRRSARHKVLDMVGDLALLGMDMHGFIVAHRSGHHTNASLVRRLLQGVEKRRSTARVFQPSPSGKTAQSTFRAYSRSLPHRYPSCWLIACLKFKPGQGASWPSRT